ncbi:hypothetical protein ACFXDH_53540 [Streptomyces sp. NPDC059467]|uniref:hypothetical protein n=1 Tax=Streptomyces sp. NPDC059467 TaxID=3346844 RepID=UPI0036A08B6E
MSRAPDSLSSAPEGLLLGRGIDGLTIQGNDASGSASFTGPVNAPFTGPGGPHLTLEPRLELGPPQQLGVRVTDPANTKRVQTNSFSRDLAGLKKFYRWMRRYGVDNPFEDFDAPRARRTEDVKWLDAGGYKRWRDLGIRGMDLAGRPDRWWRGRNEQRDAAFCDGLYGNGLRVSEWASVMLPEFPLYDRHRNYYTCQLADACAKGGYGHPYWMPRSAVKGLLSYVEGARAAAVRRAQAAGRYERVAGARLVLATHGTRAVTLEGVRGGIERKPWNDIGPRTRLRLLHRTPQGLEPLALWLNEDGLPRDGRGWEHTFGVANERIVMLGLESFTCTAHMLRHSLALKWYAIGKLVHAARLGHLTGDQRQDFREQFGDVWHLVQTMLGHMRVETTKAVYLEPFRSLDVQVLLAHADGFPVESFMADVSPGIPGSAPIPWRVSGESARSQGGAARQGVEDAARSPGRLRRRTCGALLQPGRRRPAGLRLLPVAHGPGPAGCVAGGVRSANRSGSRPDVAALGEQGPQRRGAVGPLSGHLGLAANGVVAPDCGSHRGVLREPQAPRQRPDRPQRAEAVAGPG